MKPDIREWGYVMDIFSNRLRALRSEKGEQQADVATILGVSPQSYSAYETGREPKYALLCKLAQHYDVSLDYLLGISDVKHVEDSTVAEDLGLDDRAIGNLKYCKEKALCANEFISSSAFARLMLFTTAYRNINNENLLKQKLKLHYHKNMPTKDRLGLLRFHIDEQVSFILSNDPENPVVFVEEFDDFGEG